MTHSTGRDVLLAEYQAWWSIEGYEFVHSTPSTTEMQKVRQARKRLYSRHMQFTPQLECVKNEEEVLANFEPGR